MYVKSESQRGSAIVEFVLFGIATLMPITLLLTGIFALQRGSFTAQSAVREATRAFVLSQDDSSAFAAAQAASDQTFADAGLPRVKVLITCTGSPCISPSNSVRISINFPISLMAHTWNVSAVHEERVDPWA